MRGINDYIQLRRAKEAMIPRHLREAADLVNLVNTEVVLLRAGYRLEEIRSMRMNDARLRMHIIGGLHG